jgi:pimeloyl-ACP methyl ester carboxylesterase
VGDLYVHDAGEGVPVVLLHSSGMSGRQWRRLAGSLVERGLRAVVPDLTGHGQSAAWAEPQAFSFRIDAARVVTLLSTLGRPAHLVGHSYGGFLALLAALAAPSNVLSLAVYDPVAMGTLDAAMDGDARGDLAQVGFGWDGSDAAREQWLERFVDYWMGAGGWSALREDARAEFRRVAWVVYEGARTLVSDDTPASAYRALSVPVLLIGGQASPLAARRVVQRLGETIVGAQTEELDGVGHMGPLTHADTVNDLLLRWVSAAR